MIEVDTIAAIATPVGAGGVGIVRISGAKSAAILAAISGRPVDAFPHREMIFGVARDAVGARVDEVLFVLMKGPASFTGEDVGEIHGHGGSVNMAKLLEVAIAAGARHATAGEFTRRAFENGRISLARAEAIVDVIEASSERSWRLAQAQLAGALGAKVTELRRRGVEILAMLEAAIDFPEEDIESLKLRDIADKSRVIGDELTALVKTFALGRAIRGGIDVAICGAVNAGKSSLLNALVGAERALVAEEPGTTRDFVEAQVTWSGLAVNLVDTAGRRTETSSDVEDRGIALGVRRAEQADVRVWLSAAPEFDPSPARARGDVVVMSKADLVTQRPRDVICTSTFTGEGLEDLKAAVMRAAIPEDVEGDDGAVVTSERQRGLLNRALEAFAAVAENATSMPPELLAEEVRSGNRELATVLGEEVGDEVLDELFARFCIGK